MRPRSSPIGPRWSRRSPAASSLSEALVAFVIAAVGGIAIGVVVGRVAGEILRRLDDPPVEVVISLVIPFAAYLPADRLGLSGVLAAVTAGLVIGEPAGHDPHAEQPRPVADDLEDGRVRPQRLRLRAHRARAAEILNGLGGRPPAEILGLTALVAVVVVVARIVWVFASSLLPGLAASADRASATRPWPRG